MHSFLHALGAHDYAGVCAGLAASNLKQLAQIRQYQHQGPASCGSQLNTFLTTAAAAEAKAALAGQISKVRIGKGNAFVLFRPQGGKVSYFVMKEEGGAWKATSLAPGTPLYP
jgi:hypothetical protein